MEAVWSKISSHRHPLPARRMQAASSPACMQQPSRVSRISGAAPDLMPLTAPPHRRQANSTEGEVSWPTRMWDLVPQRPGGTPVPGGKLQFWLRDHDYWAAGMGHAVRAYRGMAQTPGPAPPSRADDQQIVSPSGGTDQGPARASRRDRRLGPDTGREPAEGRFQCVPEPLPGGVLPHLPQILRGELARPASAMAGGAQACTKQVGVICVREISRPAQRGQAARAAAHARDDSPDTKHGDQPLSPPGPRADQAFRVVAAFYARARDLACTGHGSRMEIRAWRPAAPRGPRGCADAESRELAGGSTSRAHLLHPDCKWLACPGAAGRTAEVALRPGSQAVPPPALGRPAIIRPKGRPVAGNGRLEGRMRDRRAPPLPAGAARHTVPASHSHHSGSTLPPRRRAALCLRCGMRAAGEGGGRDHG